jgi:hypothetical protein
VRDDEHLVRQRTVTEDDDGHVRVVEKRRKRRKWSPTLPDGRDPNRGPAFAAALWILGTIAVLAAFNSAAGWYRGLREEFDATPGVATVTIQLMPDNSIQLDGSPIKPGNPRYDTIKGFLDREGLTPGSPPKTVTVPAQGPGGNLIDLRKGAPPATPKPAKLPASPAPEADPAQPMQPIPDLQTVPAGD